MPIGSFSSLSRDQEVHYDVIIVGGGTSGCALASRLSEDPQIRVLLLEAGSSGRARLLSRIPAAFPKLFHTKHVYELHTVPQLHLDSRRLYWPRGKLLGGCSCINAQVALYGAAQDYDEWAQLSGDNSWSFSSFQRFFQKFENVHFDATSSLDISSRGQGGPVDVGFFSHFGNLSKNFMESCVNSGISRAPGQHDSLSSLGVRRNMTFVDPNRRRVSAETSYLNKEVLSRPNLIVVLNTRVTCILFDNSPELRASGVEIARGPTSNKIRIHAKRQIILCAGAIHSPHLLLLSGVGPQEEIKRHSLSLVSDLPGVGAHLQDHPLVDLNLKDRSGQALSYLLFKKVGHVWGMAKSVVQYFTTGRGPLTTTVLEGAAFLRTDNTSLFPSAPKLKDMCSGSDAPDIEIFFSPMGYKDHGVKGFNSPSVGIHACLLRPASVGTVTLKSPDPWALPSVDPNYLQAPEDLEKLVLAVKLAFRIAQTEPLRSHLILDDDDKEFDHTLITELEDDFRIREFVRARIETNYHPVGTCRMAPLSEGGVVDAQLRVYGVQGLRICDASIFPSIVSGHTTGPCYAIAEKLAEEMKAEINVKE